MTIIVEFGGSHPASASQRVALENVQTVGEALERLGVHHHTGLIILVNGRLADWYTPLHESDTIQVIPAFAGG